MLKKVFGHKKEEIGKQLRKLHNEKLRD